MQTYRELMQELTEAAANKPTIQSNPNWGSGKNKKGNADPANRNVMGYYDRLYVETKEEVEAALDYFGITGYKVEWNPTVDGGKWEGVSKDKKGRDQDTGWVVNVKGDVDLSNQGLRRIPFIFGVVEGTFDVSHNPNIVSLTGCPVQCFNYFCNDCNITNNSLIGPIVFIGTQGNKANSPFDGVKKGIFNCANNKLKVLQNLPETVGNLICHGNPGNFTVLDLPDSSKDGQAGWVLRFEGVPIKELMKQYGKTQKMTSKKNIKAIKKLHDIEDPEDFSHILQHKDEDEVQKLIDDASDAEIKKLLKGNNKKATDKEVEKLRKESNKKDFLLNLLDDDD